MRKKLFVCQTYYHVLITLLKAMQTNEKYDLLLVDTIPGNQALEEQLKKTNIFREIHLFNVKDINFSKIKKNKLTMKKIIIHIVEERIPINFSSYDEIYLYHDGTLIGTYIITKGLYYHLIEDALDTFKLLSKNRVQIDQYINKYSLKRLIKRITGAGFVCWGFSKSCKSIEVNDINGIEIPKDKVIECPRKQLFNNLTEEQKKIIYNVFVPEEKAVCFSEKNNTVLLLTEPLFHDNKLPSEEAQIRLFKDVLQREQEKGYCVVIKPHPRDKVDYKIIFPDIAVINKNIPTEVMNYNSSIHYKKAITVTSTAIEGIEFVEEKEYLGHEFIQKYK